MEILRTAVTLFLFVFVNSNLSNFILLLKSPITELLRNEIKTAVRRVHAQALMDENRQRDRERNAS